MQAQPAFLGARTREILCASTEVALDTADG